MNGRLKRFGSAALLMLVTAGGLWRCTPDPLDAEALQAVYAVPLPAPDGPLKVYHLGHSLIGHDMPAMLEQLSEAGHKYATQIGWGATLQSHWEPDVPVNGFEEENAHDRYRDPGEALESGEYDALILTEMVEIRDAIKYFDPWDYLARFAARARETNPDIRVYFYETWHPRNDPEGWLTRLDRDLELYWQGEILDRALAADEARQPIYLIPGGQVMAAMARALEDNSVDGLGEMGELFSDDIHFNDKGAYLMALTHYAVLYQRDPAGLPFALNRADGSVADAPSAEAARLMQEVVWDVVQSLTRTGVAQGGT